MSATWTPEQYRACNEIAVTAIPDEKGITYNLMQTIADRAKFFEPHIWNQALGEALDILYNRADGETEEETANRIRRLMAP